MIYDITVYINTEDGLANGASCIVKHIEHKQSETNVPVLFGCNLMIQKQDMKHA